MNSILYANMLGVMSVIIIMTGVSLVVVDKSVSYRKELVRQFESGFSEEFAQHLLQASCRYEGFSVNAVEQTFLKLSLVLFLSLLSFYLFFVTSEVLLLLLAFSGLFPVARFCRELLSAMKAGEYREVSLEVISAKAYVAWFEHDTEEKEAILSLANRHEKVRLQYIDLISGLLHVENARRTGRFEVFI